MPAAGLETVRRLPVQQRGDAYVINAQASTRGDVGITQEVGLELQILQTVLDYITSPILMMPASLPSRSTGMWRTRWCVISFITIGALASPR